MAVLKVTCKTRSSPIIESRTDTKPMRCASYCTSSEYDTKILVRYLNEIGLEPRHFDDVIHAQKSYSKHDVDIFVFPFGCVIIWGADENEEESILRQITKYTISPLETPVSDIILCKIDPSCAKTFINEENNEIILNEESVFSKLSISHALAQSVKLNVLEQSVTNLLNQTTPIQKELAKTGTISLSKKQISKQIGILFNERYSVNLHSDILDTPEFFWRRPQYEPLYIMTAAFQDIQLRQNILNHRLNMIHELYEILSNELNYKHSTRLEWIIITLIGIEVVLAVSQHNFIPYILG